MTGTIGAPPDGPPPDGPPPDGPPPDGPPPDGPTLTWAPREPPLVPSAVAASGAAALALRAATAERLAAGAELRACADPDCLVVLGDADQLPWCDGAVYLARVGALLLPTALRPSLDASLLQVILGRAPLLAVWPGHVARSPLPARRADPALLDGGP